MTDPKRSPPFYLGWIMWGLGAVFYLSGYYQRVAPAVMTDYLMADFGIGATALGNLSAFYFYSYVAMQIPTGILADSWGAKRLLMWGACTATLGGFIFAGAPTVIFANVGRFLIGGSVGVAWVAMLKLSMHWFPPRRYALITGLALLCGIVGAVSAGVPLRIMVNHFGWRAVMLVSAGMTLVIAVAIWKVVRDDPSERGYASFMPSGNLTNGTAQSVLAGLVTVFQYKNAWLLAIAAAGVTGPILAFAGLWGIPFLSTHYGLSPTKGAVLTSILLIGFAVGGPVLGAMSDRIGRRKPLYVASCFVSCAGWSMILFVPQLPLCLLILLVSLVGFVSGTVIIGFAFVKESVPPFLAGTVSGICNMGSMAGPMVLQPLMGWVLDKHWAGTMVNGVRIYPLEGYQAAFSLMIISSILAAILIFLTAETWCKQRIN